MKDSKRHKVWLIMLIKIVGFNMLVADNGMVRKEQLNDRRQEYITWIFDNFGKLEPDMARQDGRRWALNHSRLLLTREVAKANHYFMSFSAPPRDSDIYMIRFLRTLLDFQDSTQFSDEAESRIVGFLKNWPENKLVSRAIWPPKNTENHDLMQLVLGLFARQFRGEDIKSHIAELKKFIVHRMEGGFIEFNSKCYQYHFSNPLMILADYAPDDELKIGAQMLLNLLLTERVVLGVNGYLGGPSLRCRTASANHSLTERKVAYLEDARYDGFLPTVWLALGIGEPRYDFANSRILGLEPASIYIASGNEPRLKQDEGMFFASSSFGPHPIVNQLVEELKNCKTMVYQGQRYLGWPNDTLWETQKWLPGAIYYFNTPHISMGSIHSDGWNHQSRYNSILFGKDPSMGLRLEMVLPDVAPHKRRYEARGRVVQHRNWMLGQGTLFEDGGVVAKEIEGWNIYQVGKGLCADRELGDSYHVLQVSDLDTFVDEAAFIDALYEPTKTGDLVEGVAMNGDRIVVDLADMNIEINGVVRKHPPKMLHDSRSVESEYGSGKITIRTKERAFTFDSTFLHP